MQRQNDTRANAASDPSLLIYLAADLLKDSTLERLLRDQLREQCQQQATKRAGGGGGWPSVKREAQATRKMRFHSWGGKRSSSNSDRTPKIVIRTPFRPWGGKRSSFVGVESF